MIYYLLLLTIYIWPFGQLLSFTNSTLPFSIYLLDIAVLFVSVSLVLSPKRKEIFRSSITKPLILFLGAATLSLLINSKQAVTAGFPLSVFYLLRLIIYPSLFYASKFIGVNRLRQPLLISLGIFIALSLTQYLIFPDMRFLKNLGFDDHYFRLIGPFYDPNFTGAVLAGLAMYFIAKNKLLYSIPFIALLAPTTSRASYLVFAIALIYLLVTKKKIKLLFLLMFLGATIYLIPKPFGEGVNLLRTFSIFSRIESWQQGIALFIQRPVLGWGFNTLREADGSRFQIDNSFIYLLATTGMIGLTSFVNLLSSLLKNTRDTGIKMLIVSLLLHSLFNNSLFYIWIMALLWVAAGLGQQKTKEYKQV